MRVSVALVVCGCGAGASGVSVELSEPCFHQANRIESRAQVHLQGECLAEVRLPGQTAPCVARQWAADVEVAGLPFEFSAVSPGESKAPEDDGAVTLRKRVRVESGVATAVALPRLCQIGRPVVRNTTRVGGMLSPGACLVGQLSYEGTCTPSTTVEFSGVGANTASTTCASSGRFALMTTVGLSSVSGQLTSHRLGFVFSAATDVTTPCPQRPTAGGWPLPGWFEAVTVADQWGGE